MPIEMNDPYGGGVPNIPLGQSTLPVRETYSTDRRALNEQYGANMDNVNQLVGALKEFSATAKQQDAKQQALNDKSLELNSDSMAAGTELTVNGGQGGVMNSIANGTGSPYSPGALMANAHNKGQLGALQALQTDPGVAAAMENKGLMATDPVQYRAQMNTAMAAAKAKFMANSPYKGKAEDQYYVGGFDHIVQKLGDGATADAFKTLRDTIYDQNQRAATVDTFANARNRGVQQTAFKAVQDAGADPAKFMQYMGIENRNFNANSVSSAGAGGLTQITDGRWAEIKQHIAQTNPQLADSLTNRFDPYQNARAWAEEYKFDYQKSKAALGGAEPTTAQTYMYWIYPAAADTLLKNPNIQVASVVPQNVIRANPSVFGNGNLTSQDMIDRVNQRMNGYSASQGFHTGYTSAQSQPAQMLTRDTWNDNATKWGYKWTDFKNNGVYGGDGKINSQTVSMLDQLSTFMGRKIGVLSAYRDDAYNESATGTHTHNHPSGDALDVVIQNPQEQAKAAQFLASIGAKGIGTYGTHLHFDLGHGRPGQSKPVNTWNTHGGLDIASLNSAVQTGLSQKNNAGDGVTTFYRANGFQGKPVDPQEAQIQHVVSTYGLAPKDARDIVFKTQVNSAKDMGYNGNAEGGHAALSNLRDTYGALSADEALTIDRAHNEIDTAAKAISEREDNKKEIEANQAQERESAKMLQWAKDHPGEQVPIPPRTAFPSGKHGDEAHKTTAASALGYTYVPEQYSKGVMAPLDAQLGGGDLQKFADTIGMKDVDPWKAQPNQVRAALLQKYSGQLSLQHANDLADNYEKMRVGHSVADAKADDYAKIYHAQIHSFSSTDGAQALAKWMDTYGKGASAETLAQQIKSYDTEAETFYKGNFATLYKQALSRSPNGELDGPTMDALGKMAAENTMVMRENLSKQVVQAGGNPIKAAPGQQAIIHPDLLFNPSVSGQAEYAKQPENYVQGDKALQLPPGVMLQMDPNGQPKMEKGSYAVILPDKTRAFFNPNFNVLPATGTVSPEDIAATQPPAQPQPQPAPQPQADAAPVAQPAPQPQAPVDQRGANHPSPVGQVLSHAAGSVGDGAKALADHMSKYGVEDTVRQLMHMLQLGSHLPGAAPFQHKAATPPATNFDNGGMPQP